MSVNIYNMNQSGKWCLQNRFIDSSLIIHENYTQTSHAVQLAQMSRCRVCVFVCIHTGYMTQLIIFGITWDEYQATGDWSSLSRHWYTWPPGGYFQSPTTIFIGEQVTLGNWRRDFRVRKRIRRQNPTVMKASLDPIYSVFCWRQWPRPVALNLSHVLVHIEWISSCLRLR
jgi:hypothetical protein